MADFATDAAPATWTVPRCPFALEYSTRILDEIRLAVVDAFFALPRGGAEIGGVLIGTHDPGRITISAYQPIDCEHATGPSFTLSKNDEAKLTDLLVSLRGRVVGWYHSHTRSDIFLSEADLDLYQRYFPEPWQVALVLKPHAFQPMRMGFFFREPDGSIHASAAYQEMVLEPLPIHQVPSRDALFRSPWSAPYRPETETQGALGPAIDVMPAKVEPAADPTPRRPVLVKPPEPPPAAVPEPPPAAPALAAQAPRPAPEPSLPPPPRFLLTQPEPAHRWVALLAIAAGLAIGGVAYQTKEVWLPRLTSTARFAAPPSAPPSLGLNTLDTGGQLQIRWDRNSLPARTGIAAILEISDGQEAQPQSIAMDPQHLQAGVFTYGRQAAKVEVALTIRMPDGRDVREATTYLGALPQLLPPPEDPEIRRQRDELAQQAAKLKSDLAAQEKRTKRLEKSLTDVQKALKEQQLRRLDNQLPEK